MFAFDGNKKNAALLPELNKMSEDPHGLLTPLVLLTQFCHQQNVQVNNIEFRFPNDEYKVADWLKYYDKILNEVKTYRDSDQLNLIYSEIIREFESKHVKWSKLLQDSLTIIGPNATMAQVLNNEKIILFNYEIGDRKPGFANMVEEMHRMIEKNNYFNTHDTTLIDLRILHSIHNLKAQHETYFCMCRSGPYYQCKKLSHSFRLCKQERIRQEIRNYCRYDCPRN